MAASRIIYEKVMQCPIGACFRLFGKMLISVLKYYLPPPHLGKMQRPFSRQRQVQTDYPDFSSSFGIRHNKQPSAFSKSDNVSCHG